MDLTLLLGWDREETVEDVANAHRAAAPRSRSPPVTSHVLPDQFQRLSPPGQSMSPPEVRKPALLQFDGMPSRIVDESKNSSAQGRLGAPRGIGIAKGILNESRSLPERGNDVEMLVDTLRRVREALSEGIQVSAAGDVQDRK